MVRLTLVAITLVVISLMFMGISYAQIWYEEDFDDFDDGDVAGQDEWVRPVEWFGDGLSPTIQGDVAFGDTGKSVLVEEGTLLWREFPDTRTGIQHVSFRSRKDSDTAEMLFYIGGPDLPWIPDTSYVFFLIAAEGERGGFADLVGFDGVTGTKVPSAEIELGEWYHLHVVLDVDSKTHDIYLDGELVVDDLTNRGDGVDPSLNWIAFGWDQAAPLVAYVDNISIGTGAGDPTTAVSSLSKLATTWAALKR